MGPMRRVRDEPPEELRRAVAHLRRVVLILPVLLVIATILLAL